MYKYNVHCVYTPSVGLFGSAGALCLRSNWASEAWKHYIHAMRYICIQSRTLWHLHSFNDSELVDDSGAMAASLVLFFMTLRSSTCTYMYANWGSVHAKQFPYLPCFSSPLDSVPTPHAHCLVPQEGTTSHHTPQTTYHAWFSTLAWLFMQDSEKEKHL